VKNSINFTLKPTEMKKESFAINVIAPSTIGFPLNGCMNVVLVSIEQA
jgi:hypothetical protein